jgi:hypothetical protein
VTRNGSVDSLTPASQRRGLGQSQLSRGRAFVAMNKQEQLKFIAEKFREMDSTELASIMDILTTWAHGQILNDIGSRAINSFPSPGLQDMLITRQTMIQDGTKSHFDCEWRWKTHGANANCHRVIDTFNSRQTLPIRGRIRRSSSASLATLPFWHCLCNR